MKETIIFVNSIPSHVWGGGENWMCQLARAFHERGYRVGLVCRPNSKLIEEFNEFSQLIYPLKFGCDFNPLSILKLAIFFKKVKANYLILNFNKDVSIAGIAGRLIGVKKIIFRNGYPLIHNKRKHKMLLPFFDLLVSNSLALVNHYKTYNWGLEKKSKVIYNGIRLDQGFKRNYEKNAQQPFIIFGAGRLVAAKRFDIFVELIARLKKEFWVHGMIAGDGPEIENLKLLSYAFEADIEYTGFVQSIHPFLKKADIFLHTSRKEGIPNVVLEAMALGLPVVTTNAGGTNELVTDNVNGLICEVDDVDPLYQRLKLLMSDANLRQKLGEEAQKTIMAKFNLNYSVDQYESLFK